MTVSLCKHRFPLQPPHGSFFRPGDCTGCGMTHDQWEAERHHQHEALLHGTARDGTCPTCRRIRRLYQWQAAYRPWHPYEYEPPVTWPCADCWNAATVADQAVADGLLAELGGTT